MEAKLYVGNLSYSTSEDDLRTLFAQAGTVVSAAVITDRDTGTSKGFGFVEMTSQVDAQKAISMFNEYQNGRAPADGEHRQAARRAQQPWRRWWRQQPLSQRVLGFRQLWRV